MAKGYNWIPILCCHLVSLLSTTNPKSFSIQKERGTTEVSALKWLLHDMWLSEQYNTPFIFHEGEGRSHTKKEIHLRKAEAARSAKKNAKNLAIQSSHHVPFTFDWQKTLPTPYLTCSKVYYLRQLWTYNFGVHNLASGTGTMFMWSENEASRGSQEILSCLYRFISGLSPDIKHIDAFSENAGGQNKNKHIVKFWSFVVSNTPVETIDHKFLVSGHSFMEVWPGFRHNRKGQKEISKCFCSKWLV